jgi:hypothetical protein
MRQGIIDNHARSISDHHRYPTLVITVATVPGTITNNHIPSAALQQLLTFCTLLMSISISLANNSNTYTLHRSLLQLHSHIVLVYFRLPPRLPIPTFHSRHRRTPSVPSHLHLVRAISDELRRVRGLIVERRCGDLWGRRERLLLLGG